MENLEQVTIISDVPLNELYKKYSFSKPEVSICEGVGERSDGVLPFPTSGPTDRRDGGVGKTLARPSADLLLAGSLGEGRPLSLALSCLPAGCGSRTRGPLPSKPACWVRHSLSHVYWQERGRGSGRKGGCPQNVAGETQTRLFSIWEAPSSLQRCRGAAQATVFLAIWDSGQLKMFAGPKHCQAQGMVLPNSGVKMGLSLGSRQRGPLWNSLMRPEGTGEAAVLPPVRPEAGAAGRRGKSNWRGDEAEMQVWRGGLSALLCVFKTHTHFPASDASQHSYFKLHTSEGEFTPSTAVAWPQLLQGSRGLVCVMARTGREELRTGLVQF